MSLAAGARKPVGVVLAGGRSSRFGGRAKALAELGGKPLAQHVIERLAGQVNSLLISVQDTDPALTALGGEPVLDVVQRHRGPLTGLCSALLRLECRGPGEWLLLCPCDAPFLPRDLGARLAEAARASDQPVAVARYQGIVQPVFSLWSLAALPVVRAAVMDHSQGGLMRLLQDIPHALADWPEQEPNPFFNVNTPDDLEAAQRWLDDGTGQP